MATPVSLIYLDVDDEITSAANRIRNETTMRVALVLPSGSRVATSRINFRLLAREAQAHGHDLYIVAPEAATRALAGTAGLPVFATVRDLEAEMADGEGPGRDDGAAAGGGATAGVVAAGEALASDDAPAPRPRDMATPIVERARTPASSPVAGLTGERVGTDARLRNLSGRSAAADLPVVAGARRRIDRRVGWLPILAVIVVVAFVGGFLGAQLLPAATIVVTPKVEPIELTFNVTADPTATASDTAAGIVPATLETIPLDASGDYSATGRKVSETKATGTVTFSSYDTGGSNTIPAGSIVATQSNRQFVTKDTVILPPATLVGPPPFTVAPSTGDSAVTAVKPGTSGNVAAGAIRIVPPGENPIVTKVTNKAPTSGGTHTETLIVSQKDIDKALADLTSQIDAAFTHLLAEPGQILPDMTIFPETKSRTAAVPSVDPKTLLGDQVQSFSLGATATGTVTAVDETAVSALATARLRSTVAAGQDLVKDSLSATVGQGKVQGTQIVFSVKAVAQQVRRLVAADLRDQIKGLPVADARTRLEVYGTATIDLWPGFVSSIPTNDFRINLTIAGAVPIEGASPGPGSTGSPGASASPRPTASPRAPDSGSPKPPGSGTTRPSASASP